MGVRHLTNEQFIKKAMNYSKFGALKQAFLLTAIEKYAELCIEAGAEKFDSGLLHGKAWIGVAEEWRREVREHLG